MDRDSFSGTSVSNYSFMTFPKNEVAKNMIYNRMKCHYKRLCCAKAKVDTNLPKPPKNSIPLSREICDIVNRNYYCHRSLPKHRKCLKELEDAGFHFKPIILNSNAESKLRSLDVYYPPVRTPNRARSRQSKLDKSEDHNELEEEDVDGFEAELNVDVEEQKTVIEVVPLVEKKECSVQTERVPKQKPRKEATFRPMNVRALDFLRDITDDVLSKGVYTDESLERIFNNHMNSNKHSLDVETMLNEIDRLKDEVGIPRPGLRRCTHSDKEAIEALDSLQLDPVFKEDIINSLRLNSHESYHCAVFESQSSSSSELLNIKHSVQNDRVNSEERDEHVQKTLSQHTEKLIEKDFEAVKSTASEVSDIEDDNSIISGESVEAAKTDNSSASKRSHTKSINSNGKLSLNQKTLNESSNHTISKVINKEHSNSTNEHSATAKDVHLRTGEETSREKVLDTDTGNASENGRSSEFVNAEIHEDADQTEELTDDENSSTSVDENSNNRESDVEQRSKNDSSSDMSSVHTEPSIDF